MSEKCLTPNHPEILLKIWKNILNQKLYLKLFNFIFYLMVSKIVYSRRPGKLSNIPDARDDGS